MAAIIADSYDEMKLLLDRLSPDLICAPMPLSFIQRSELERSISINHSLGVAIMEVVSFIDPQGQKLYCIGPFREKAQASRAAAGIEQAATPASGKRNQGVTKRAQAIFSLLGAGKSRRELIAECERQGINKGTAATQYQKWKKASAAA